MHQAFLKRQASPVVSSGEIFPTNIVPASYYFEWKHLKNEDNLLGEKVKPEKYMFQTEGSSVTWMCGLYRIEDVLPFAAERMAYSKAE